MQFQHRDPLQLEDELEKCQRKIRELEMDISFEQNNNKDLVSLQAIILEINFDIFLPSYIS